MGRQPNKWEYYITALELFIAEMLKAKGYDKQTVAELIRHFREVNANGLQVRLAPPEQIAGMEGYDD